MTIIDKLIYKAIRFFKKIEKKYRVPAYLLSNKTIQIMDNSFIDAMTEIGNYSYIGYNVFITKANIGRYVSIANNVSIGMGEHHLDKISTNSVFFENESAELTQKNCIIGHDVWIGADSLIRRGVTVGVGAVIGANSVVTKDVPNFAIVAGVPARIIRYRFDEKKQEQILKSKWWQEDINAAKVMIEFLEKDI